MKGFAARLRLLPRGLRWGACAWLVAVLLLAVHQWHFWRSPALGVEVFALLPQDARHAAADEAVRRLAEQLARQVVVVVGGDDWGQASATARALTERLTAPGAPFQSGADALDPARALAAYAPWRDALLTSAQRQGLHQSSRDALLHDAMGRLYGMGSVGQPVAWLNDPLGLWREWWAERGGLTAARPRDGMLWVADEATGRQWAVVLLETRAAPFRFDGASVWQEAIDRAWSEVAQPPHGSGLIMRAAGVPLHAEAGAVQGHREMSTIGGGALVGVVLMTALVFGGIRPLLPVALSVAVGCAAGLSAVNLLFGQVHLLTLVFGASLVGVAVDYGFHYFCARAGTSGSAAATVRRMLPALSLALLTSTLGYLVLGVAPFPGLRQMAVFSAAGLLGAFVTVVLWFPLLEGRHVRVTRLGQWLADTLVHWPRPGRVGMTIVVLFASFIGAGLMRLSTSDDLRQLHASPPRLAQAQAEVSRLLGMASPSQLFLVRGASEEEVLQREEALKDRLAAHGSEALDGVRLSGLSDWVPSAARQAADRALTARVETQVIEDVARLTGESLARPAFAVAPLSVSTLLSSDGAPHVARAQWLGDMDGGQASVMLVHGLRDARQAQTLRALADGLPGVTWVDRAADVGALLGTFRESMAWLLVAAHGLILIVLSLRLRSRGWRAWLPCAIATLATLGWLGWLGEPFQLFNLLALVLLLGMGVDYGIFLQAQPASDRTHAWLAIVLAACSTALSFGLLALSSTPALRAFGLTLLIGLLHVSLIAPVFGGAATHRRQIVTRCTERGEDNESRER